MHNLRLAASPWETVIGLGIGWMMIGMLVMPAGVSYNPGRLYQISLVALLYLPALYLAVRRRGALWRELWPQPAFRVFLLLLAWATLSLCWARLERPGDEFGRIFSVLLFVLGCHLWCGEQPVRMETLLAAVGWAMAVTALVYSVAFLRQSHPANLDDARIVGEGVIATSNYAAAAMGAACVWLAQLPGRGRRWMAACVVSFAALLLFIALTQSRGVWLALAVCALATPLWQRRRTAALVALAVLVLGVAALAWPLPVLMERGASYRPQILAKALHLIAARPWLGLGQGTDFTIVVDGQHLTHSHNVLTQAAIVLGLPGLAAMAAMWALVAWSGWRHRSEPLGRVTLGLWVYASVALQFDMPQLLDSPRPGWLLIWLPFALALGLEARTRRGARPHVH
jgi:O-antigen ligase